MLIYEEINLCTIIPDSGVFLWAVGGGIFLFLFFSSDSIGKAISDQLCTVPRLQIR